MNYVSNPTLFLLYITSQTFWLIQYVAGTLKRICKLVCWGNHKCQSFKLRKQIIMPNCSYHISKSHFFFTLYDIPNFLTHTVRCGYTQAKPSLVGEKTAENHECQSFNLRTTDYCPVRPNCYYHIGKIPLSCLFLSPPNLSDSYGTLRVHSSAAKLGWWEHGGKSWVPILHLVAKREGIFFFSLSAKKH